MYTVTTVGQKTFVGQVYETHALWVSVAIYQLPILCTTYSRPQSGTEVIWMDPDRVGIYRGHRPG